MSHFDYPSTQKSGGNSNESFKSAKRRLSSSALAGQPSLKSERADKPRRLAGSIPRQWSARPSRVGLGAAQPLPGSRRRRGPDRSRAPARKQSRLSLTAPAHVGNRADQSLRVACSADAALAATARLTVVTRPDRQQKTCPLAAPARKGRSLSLNC